MTDATELGDWLRRRDPGPPTTFVETHISILAFHGDRVYKCKKPVRFPFVDLSTRARRRADCEREVALNRRLAPDAYLGVEDVTDERGVVIDHVVVMARQPEESRLSARAEHGGDVSACLDALASLLAAFHARTATGGAVDAAATRDAVAELWERELAEFGGGDEIAARARRYLAGRGPLFDDRIRAGRARDGHGDLLADDVFCRADGPRVLDCLEFDDRLRYGDTLADVAFLAMDLERLGRADAAHEFLARYRAVSGDDWPDSLRRFYTAYRAHVRAKVASLRDDTTGARALLSLARDHLERGCVRMVLVGGPPATGKSTVAAALAAATSWPVLRSDVLRKELAGVAPTRDASAPLDAGIYTPDWTARTYEELCARARARLERGESVILDASWANERMRTVAGDVARSTATDVIALRCDAPLDVTSARAATRTRARSDVSDADGAIAIAAAARFAPWPDAFRLDTTQPPDTVARTATALVGPV